MCDSTRLANAERQVRIRHVVDGCIDRRTAGDEVTDESLIAAHPDLMPELAKELAAVGAPIGVSVLTPSAVATGMRSGLMSIPKWPYSIRESPRPRPTTRRPSER